MGKIARVLLAAQGSQLDRLFDYLTPPEFEAVAKVGARVLVPFRNRPSLGYIWQLTEDSEVEELKTITQVLDDPPLLTGIQYQLVDWMADYYYCSRADGLKHCFPPGSNPVRIVAWRLNYDLNEINKRLAQRFSESEVNEGMALLGELNGRPVKEWEKRFIKLPQLWEYLIKNRIIVKNQSYTVPKTKPKTCRVYCWAAAEVDEPSDTGKRVQAVLLREQMLSRAELCAAAEVSPSVIDRLVREGKVVCKEIEQERKPAGFSEMAQVAASCRLTPEQEGVFQQIAESQGADYFLLHGVTGSGKTEIYFKAAAETLKQGKQVLYLVPEIALTPQTLERARQRFGDQVALLHSNMSPGERFDQWFKIKNGKANLVLGARSALFAPFERLGLIIVDEEHETSYKQEETPRYHTGTVVQKLAELTGAKVIFGSATPSLESFHAAQNGKFRYLGLPERFNRRRLPQVSIVDMREELRRGNKNILSASLHEAIESALAQREQVILLLNRRGYSTFVLCRDCGYTLTCPACDVSLTYHNSIKVLRCHYCDFRKPVPDLCPKCQSSRIRYFGHGTQKLEEELKTFFPQAKIIRMDLDSTSGKGSHHRIYQELVNGRVDILLGTQMVAKGLDLPRVTLVGVISADSTLNIPDFRAAERTFQLLTQVAGRAGRGEKASRVIFQTYNPEHYSLQLAKDHDYFGFYRAEIERRRELQYPPFTELVKIAFSGVNLGQVREAAQTFAGIFREYLARICGEPDQTKVLEVMGPAPALIPKIESKYRWQLLIKSHCQNRLNELINSSWAAFPFRKFSDVKIIRDRNPYSIL